MSWINEDGTIAKGMYRGTRIDKAIRGDSEYFRWVLDTVYLDKKDREVIVKLMEQYHV